MKRTRELLFAKRSKTRRNLAVNIDAIILRVETTIYTEFAPGTGGGIRAIADDA